MSTRNKILAIIATGTVVIASCFSIQTFYTDDATAESVALRTAQIESREDLDGNMRTSDINADITATQLATSSTTGSLQSSLESESSERKTQDEKISKSIGAINNTLLGYIGSASTNKIGDGTLRGAIGNNSIAGIGTENNITSAIVGINGKTATNADAIEDLQTETASLDASKTPFINSSDAILYHSLETSHPTDNTSYKIWTATEDCWATGYGSAYGNFNYNLYISIGDTRVISIVSANDNCFIFPVKKGQTVYKANGYLRYIAFYAQA